MLKIMQNLICSALMLAVVFAVIEARPSNAESNHELDALVEQPDLDDMRSSSSGGGSSYYDSAAQPLVYPSIPMDRLQMLIAQYRPNAYLRSPTWNNMNELFRVPETKRQVRYRQCYFNPISCFKK